jgi:hypothetical protein
MFFFGAVFGGGMFLSGIVSGSDLVFVGGWKTPPQFPTWLIDGWCLLVGMEMSKLRFFCSGR